ncbi:hypothetical protein BDV96DRAFT_648145 [Lophiotrema nucula]|uniref:Protein kinase domain-containing protein n=1 Tax=Lophiotrema nucula TaxID=690887 RepID=A0A6A5Z165_9PLEO|nr:hypothetical protein BDV96DRAFT_648145 [Lophiotrema nucula]
MADMQPSTSSSRDRLMPPKHRFVHVDDVTPDSNDLKRAIHFVIPRSAVPSNIDRTSISQSHKSLLMSKVYIVKMGYEAKELQHERDVLSYLQAQPDHEKHVGGLLIDFDLANIHPWLQISVVHGPDLGQLLFDALTFLYRIKVVHADLLPQNVMLRKTHNSMPDVVLIDFGAAKLHCDEFIRDGEDLMITMYKLISDADHTKATEMANEEAFFREASDAALKQSDGTINRWEMDTLRKKWYVSAKEESEKLKVLPDWVTECISEGCVSTEDVENALEID